LKNLNKPWHPFYHLQFVHQLDVEEENKLFEFLYKSPVMRQLHQVLDQQDDQHDIKLDQFLFQHQLIHQVPQTQDHFVQHKVKQFLKEVDDIEDDLHYLLIQYPVEPQFLDQPIMFFCFVLN